MGDVVPLFGFYKGLVVVQREGFDKSVKIENLRSRNMIAMVSGKREGFDDF